MRETLDNSCLCMTKTPRTGERKIDTESIRRKRDSVFSGARARGGTERGTGQPAQWWSVHTHSSHPKGLYVAYRWVYFPVGSMCVAKR